MNIKEITAAFKAERRGISFAFLAERTETSADSPYRIKPAETVRPDETLVCVIGGSGGKGDHIRSQRRFLDLVKAQRFDAGQHLPQLCILELAGDRGRHYSIDMRIRVPVALFQKGDDIQNEGFVQDCAERALIYAGPAGNAGVVVDIGDVILCHGNRPHFARVPARPLVHRDRVIWTYA